MSCWLWAIAAVRYARSPRGPALRRFGAAQTLRPGAAADRCWHRRARAPAERRAPDELRGFAGELAAGGAGPGYGIVR